MEKKVYKTFSEYLEDQTPQCKKHWKNYVKLF